MNTRAPRGFTMIELGVMLAVLAVLVALALPGMGARLDRQRLQGAAEALLSDVKEARFEAAQRGVSIHIVADTGAAWCWAVATSADCPCGQAQACVLRKAGAEDHAGVRLLQAQALRLTPQGQVEAAGSATLESRRGEQLRVEVQALGHPHICSPEGTHPRYPAC